MRNRRVVKLKNVVENDTLSLILGHGEPDRIGRTGRRHARALAGMPEVAAIA
jgi:hypothetical protein